MEYRMAIMIRKNLYLVGKGKLITLFLGSLLYGMSERVAASLTYEQHILSVITDHYYLIYLIIPLYLFICFTVIEDDSEVVIMRYGSYSRYFLSKSASIAVISMIFIGILLIAIFVTGIGLPFENEWMLSEGAIQRELFAILSGYFTSPLSCMVVSTFYMFLGLCVSGIFCMWIAHFLPKSWTIKLVMGLYIFTAVVIKIPVLQSLPMTGFNYWIIFHHNLLGENRLLITVVTTIVLIIVILYTVKRHWNWQFSIQLNKKIGLTPYYCREALTKKNLLILTVVLSVLAIWKYLQNPNVIVADDWIIRLFAGHGIGQFHLISFLEMLLSNGLPIYLLAVFIERVTSNHSIFVTIRLKKRFEIIKGILQTSFIFMAFYGLLLLAIPVLGILSLNLQISTQTISLLFFCVGLKLLDITIQYLLIMVIYSVTKEITIGFLVMIGINLLCILPEAISAYLPFGCSSLARHL